MIINVNGYFEDEKPAHPIDKELGKFLVTYYKNYHKSTSILDLGCGNGYYTKLLRDAELDCDGYDGNPNTVKLTNGMCGILDLTVPFKLVMNYRCVLCLEVGEHIPREHTTTFIQNLHRNNTHEIVLSWAVPGQGGHGHVNELPNETIIDIFENLGYFHEDSIDQMFREHSSLPWYKNTIMVFSKNLGG